MHYIKIDKRVDSNPMCWQNFLKYFRSRPNWYDLKFNDRMKHFDEELSKYKAVRVDWGSQTSHVQFESEHYMNLFLVRWS